jgi:hypothetical protein
MSAVSAAQASFVVDLIHLVNQIHHKAWECTFGRVSLIGMSVRGGFETLASSLLNHRNSA